MDVLNFEQERQQAVAMYGGTTAPAANAKTFEPDEELAGAAASSGGSCSAVLLPCQGAVCSSFE